LVPKWGVITTSRIIEDVVILLKDLGVADIVIGEGIIQLNPKNKDIAAHAAVSLGYDRLKEKYGVKFINVFERPFTKAEAYDGTLLHINEDALTSDMIINIPVLKTHAQTVVSLGMKNIKGILNIASRKKCHSEDPEKPLDYMISLLPDMLPPMATIIDGIYSLERGPAPDGTAKRTNCIIASNDTLSADMVGSMVLGHSPVNVPSLAHALQRAGRPADLSDIEITGGSITEFASPHKWGFQYTEDNMLHAKMAKMGITGLAYRKYDDTMCTYCSMINGAILASIMLAWKGEPWGEIDICTGKRMEPLPGKDKTVLLGQCMVKKHSGHPNIKELFAIPGCPPDPITAAETIRRAGIPVETGIFQNIDGALGFMMAKYKDKPEFEESFFRID
jgi:uncharacterized protein (DUF362 family)